MSHGDPCRNCGHCPCCGQPWPARVGPYYPPYQPYYPPTIPPVIYPQVAPWQPYPGDIYVGDPPPGMAPIITCTTSTVYAN